MLPRFGRTLIAFVLASLALLRFATSTAAAQTDDDLAGARKLFTEALKDEQDTRFDVALDKFRQVQRVRDTVNVRYRIGTCLEGTGQLAAALKAYQGAVDMGATDKASADVVRASNDRVAQLDKTVPRLTLTLSANAPAGAEVSIDDAKVAPEELGAPIPVDAGHHTISAHAVNATDFHTSVTLPEGGRVSLTIPLEPSNTMPGNGQPPPPPLKPEQPATDGSGTRTAGYVIAIGGGVLIA